MSARVHTAYAILKIPTWILDRILLRWYKLKAIGRI